MDHLPSYPCAKLKLDQFFLQWLSEHQEVINSLLDDAITGRPLRGPLPIAVGPSPLSPSTAHAIFSSATAPPVSPSKGRGSPRSPLSPQRKATLPAPAAALRPPLSALPQFYFPSKHVVSDSSRIEFQQRVDKLFAAHPAGMGIEAFAAMTQEVGDLPRMVGRTLFRRLAGPEGTAVTRQLFMSWWLAHDMLGVPTIKRVFEVLRQEGRDYLAHDDFKPLMAVILAHHPGLEFLVDTAEFQAKYSETVVFRIFYALNRSGSGRLTLRELRRSDLLEALDLLDSEDDINKVLKYFSYEHFYVIYCKFWELDSDHDFLLEASDLAKYGQCALSFQIIDRIFAQVPRPFTSGVPDKMCYQDFVWFILCEEDKSSDTSLEYWFKCVDLDCDGVIRPREMWYFYEEQLKRLEGLGQEPVLFPDVLCQMHDMLKPEVEGAYTLRDLKRMRPHSAFLFNALFNLQKLLSFENRDPFASRAESAEFGGMTDWDKFARQEYQRLANEEETEEVHMEAEEASWPDTDTAMMDVRGGPGDPPGL